MTPLYVQQQLRRLVAKAGRAPGVHAAGSCALLWCVKRPAAGRFPVAQQQRPSPWLQHVLFLVNSCPVQ